MTDLWKTTWPIALLAGLAGCEGPAWTTWQNLGVYERLQHADPAARLQAVVEVGQTKDPKALPYLVDRLTDSESEVRMFAIVSLQKMTGQTLGYRHYDPPTVRAAAVARWRSWLERRASGGSGEGAGGQASTQPSLPPARGTAPEPGQ